MAACSFKMSTSANKEYVMLQVRRTKCRNLLFYHLNGESVYTILIFSILEYI
jgi:hypothetical protein